MVHCHEAVGVGRFKYFGAQVQRPLPYLPMILMLWAFFGVTWDKGRGGCSVDEPVFPCLLVMTPVNCLGVLGGTCAA